MSDIIYLSEKQKQVLDYLLKGLTLKEIALRMNISYSRITNLLTELLVKTHFKSRNELLVNGKELTVLIKARK